MSSLRSRFKGPNAEERFIRARDKARETARVAMERKRSGEPSYQARIAFYNELAAMQGGERCWICNAEPTTKRLCIDHDHATDEIRGLLCAHCNLILARAEDSVERLQKAIEYLSRPSYTGRMFAEVPKYQGRYPYPRTSTKRSAA